MIQGEQRHRPDLVGLILDRVALPAGTFIVAYEVWPGASAEPTASQLLDSLVRNSKVCVISPGKAIRCWEAERSTAGLFG